MACLTWTASYSCMVEQLKTQTQCLQRPDNVV